MNIDYKKIESLVQELDASEKIGKVRIVSHGYECSSREEDTIKETNAYNKKRYDLSNISAHRAYVYLVFNKFNDIVRIGQTSQTFEKRWDMYIYRGCRQYSDYYYYVSEGLSVKAAKYTVVIEVVREQRLRIEGELIDRFNPIFNSKPGWPWAQVHDDVCKLRKKYRHLDTPKLDAKLTDILINYSRDQIHKIAEGNSLLMKLLV